jgi:hypothetical protein
VATNEAVLKHLQMACYRQIPWHRRPPLFNRLAGCGLIRIRRVPPIVNGKAPALFDMAALTVMGRLELDRLQRVASRPDWQTIAQKRYEAGDPPILSGAGPKADILLRSGEPGQPNNVFNDSH